MHVFETIPLLRSQRTAWRGAGQSIAFVPTMGGLHAGHLTLVDRARQEAERVIVSLFVNPLQFDRADDYQRYPRRAAEDRAALEARGVDAVFQPTVEVLYPRGQAATTRVSVPELSDVLCGAARPGHFEGVATVVTMLLNIVQPTVAVFGRKDYQQLIIIQRLVQDLHLPVRILGVPTVREADGLALSSRNQYLSAEERARAPALYGVLRGLAERLGAGERALGPLCAEAETELRAAGLQPDYVAIRRPGDLAPCRGDESAWVVLGAAWLGQARLIDNVLARLEHGAIDEPELPSEASA